MERRVRLALAALLGVQAGFAGLNLLLPGWALVDLDAEHNLPTWFHSALLAGAAVLALDVLRLEARLLARAGRGRGWALAWLGLAGAFVYLAVDESLVIHEGLYTGELEAWLAPTSALRLTLAWLVVFLPAVVGGTAFLLASLGARVRLAPGLLAWGIGGLALWVSALTLEGTAKAFFMPRNLYWLEVILEETAETLGTTCVLWGLWRYRLRLAAWGASPAGQALPAFAVPWRWVAGGTLALALPVTLVGLAIAWNPDVLQRYLGDDHAKAGRLAEAGRAYRAALALAPRYRQAWTALGLVELARDDLAAAEQAFGEAERLDPSRAAAANDRGVALFRMGRHAEAVDAFARAAERAPGDAVILGNFALGLERVGRRMESRAAQARARAIRPETLTATLVSVALPADVALAYVDDARLGEALALTRAGRVQAALAGYRHALRADPGLAAAHLGAANELVRWAVGRRLAQAGAAARVGPAEAAPVTPSALFADWLREPDGRWTAMEATAEPPPPAGDGLALEAAAHYRRALALGALAPAELGLAVLAREAGRGDEAARHLAAARAADPALPALGALRLAAGPGPRRP